MNREILFRGKSVETNEWVYGSYVLEKYSNTPYICYFEYGTFVNIKQIEVYPETVGEFTGIIINDNNVFEGDIVKRTGGLKLIVGEVVMNCGPLIRYSDEYSDDGYSFASFSQNEYWQDGNASGECKYRFSLLGNKFDNPEFLSKE